MELEIIIYFCFYFKHSAQFQWQDHAHKVSGAAGSEGGKRIKTSYID